MRTKIILALAVGLVGFAFAGSTCNQAAGKQISGLAVYSPDKSTGPTLGQSFEIKWQPTSGYSTVSILLLKGPSTNVVPYSCIANSIPNSGSYTWSVPSSGLNAQSTGYGIQIIADGSGDFQYSSQFGISDGSSSSTSGDVVAITSTTRLSGKKITQTIFHTPSTSSCSTSSTSSTESSSSSSPSNYHTAYSSHKVVHSHHRNHTSKAYPTAYSSKVASAASAVSATSAGNVTESVTPTVSMSVPASLANVGGSGHEITSAPVAAAPSSTPTSAPSTTASKAAAPKMVVGGALVGLGALAALAL